MYNEKRPTSTSRYDVGLVLVPVREPLFLVTFFAFEVLWFEGEVFTAEQGCDAFGVRVLPALLAVALFHIVCGFGVGGDDALEVSENHFIGTL